jgi:hypothetical protein
LRFIERVAVEWAIAVWFDSLNFADIAGAKQLMSGGS